ncbi:MAG: ribonuclease T2 family protein, partial [Oceanobacter sp.]
PQATHTVEDFGDLPPVGRDVLESYLCMSPGMRLLQGEWEKHGACTFDEPKAYFNKSLELFKRYDLPPADMNARDAMNWMKDNNPELKGLWLHLTDTEFGICFNAEFDPQSCPGMIQ